MTSDVYIFGYQSILALGSLSSSVGIRPREDFPIPARLPGWIRDWSAVRSFDQNESKRYVHTSDRRVAKRVAFANLVSKLDSTVNGVCRRIQSTDLTALDFREQGYSRLDVRTQIEPYAGFALDRSIPCYTYIDFKPNPQPAMVSEAYFEMGRKGALNMSHHAPTFYADYLASTQQPVTLAPDLAFTFWSADGCHLWLLEESDSSLVLLLSVKQPQFAHSPDTPPEVSRCITKGLEWLDLRYRNQTELQLNKRIPMEMAHELILTSTPDELFTSRFWLCRLAAANSLSLLQSRLQTLIDDSDYWVRRSARIEGNRSGGTRD